MLVSFLIWTESDGSEEGGFILPRSVIITGTFFPRCYSVLRGCYSTVASAPGWGKGSLPLYS